MLTFNGYFPKRRGVLEHLRDGRLSIMDYVVFDLLLIWADANTGIATTNGPGLVFLSGNQLKLDTVQTSLRNLEAGKYIARPFYVQGQRGDQKIFIDKFVCTKGKLKGKVLSFTKTTDWQNPAYGDLTENPTESHTEDQCDNQPVNQPSNETLKTENGNRKRVSVRKTGHSLREDQLSESNPNTLTGSEFARAVGAVEHPSPVKPQDSVPNPARGASLLDHTEGTSRPRTPRGIDPASLAPAALPHSAAPRPVIDKYRLKDEWRKFVQTVEVPVGAEDLLTPGDKDLIGILEDNPDSVERIIEVSRWAIEVSDYWFKKKDGMIRTSTDFRNAYPTMSRQFQNYKKKGAAV